MSAIPLRCRVKGENEFLFVNDTGSFFLANHGFARRLHRRSLTPGDETFLGARGHLVDEANGFELDAHAFNIAERINKAGALDYLILVPTLRCNLSCSYCQVSRAAEKARGFDWTEDHLEAVGELLDSLETDHIKIEFQGGEPTLRPDLIRAVIERCGRFSDRQFVICTNLQHLTPEILELFDRPDLFISTSLDGGRATHERNRTKGRGESFFTNLDVLLDRYGPGKISALPTIDPTAPPDIDELIDAFRSRGLTRIFLRPINFQGFARKRHSHSREQDGDWRAYYERFVRRLIELNWSDRSKVLEETYLSICLGRIFRPGRDRHVDLRNPNPAGLDYLVIDYEGSIYPTDEARMLTRSKVVDLRLGTVGSDWKGDTWRLLNSHSTNQFDPACNRCAYQPFCGRDLVDDLARYGRIDLPRTSTEFCRKHLWLFDLIFELVYDPDPAVQHSLKRWLRLDTEPVLGEVLE
jgi:His-Xaa-Ser system radical SAM maturase HxsB